MKKIWQKKEGMVTDTFNEQYLVSKGVPDNALIPYDIAASKAHATMLESIGILTKEENTNLQEGLDEILDLYTKGEFSVTVADEDCHSAIERFLTEKCGDAGKKIHTGRSRNDQVLVATRLYMKDALLGLREGTEELAKHFLQMAKKHQNVPFPGYTHSQQAMLSSLGHYFCSFVESLIDDKDFIGSVLHGIDKNPLGSAAGFGVAIPLDRELTTRELGFSQVQMNSLYCQTSRGKFESMTLEAIVQLMLTLGRFAQDMILFTTREFGYFHVDDSMTTGSSIMPQKKNLDYMEVLRGQVSVAISLQHQIQDVTKNQLSGYNKDLKFVKKAMLDAFDIATSSVVIVGKMLDAIHPNEDVIESKISKDIFAADVANDLVKNEGMPFRDAYRVAMERLDGLVIDYQKNIQSKVSPGAPGNLGIDRYEKILGL